MSRRMGTVLFFSMVAVGVAAATLTSVYRERNSDEPYVTTGRVRAVDIAHRTASLEVKDPRTGRSVVYEGKIADDCRILIDGRQASLRDVRIADRAEVGVRRTPQNCKHAGGPAIQLVAESIQITRSDG